MIKETRTVVYDVELKLEAYHFQGIMQTFPLHFHDYYVISFIENGQRCLTCRSREYVLEPGDLLLMNARDNHSCEQVGSQPMDYRSLNISPEVMGKAVFEITGKEYLPYFSPQVVCRSELVPMLRELHQIIMQEASDFRKEELFFFLLEQLVDDYTEGEIPAGNAEQSTQIQAVCNYLEQHYMDSIRLEDLCGLTGLSKYYLLRFFTKQKGISPYNYLETLRIDKAKKLLEQGVLPLEAAMQTGFNDQSHFTNFFKKFIGLTPKQYMNIFRGTQR